MTFFVCVLSLPITPARPTSDPVPAVVGTAMIGNIPSGSARVHQSPTSSKSQIGRVCPDIKAITLPTSSAEPPPNAITPSWSPACKATTPSVTFLSMGLLLTSEKTLMPSPACLHALTASRNIGNSTRPPSVTSNGRLIPSDTQTSGNSLIRPAPKRMSVGYDQLPV